jgi:hypothetical protein
MASQEYVPDRWTVVQVCPPSGEVHYRILGSWYGGFFGSDVWKLSSGIEAVEEHEHHWRVPQTSGSVYICAKPRRGMSSLAANALADLQERIRAAGGEIRELDGLAQVRSALQATRPG